MRRGLRHLTLVALLLLPACGKGRSQFAQGPTPLGHDVPSVYQALQTYYLEPQNIPPDPAAFATVSSLLAALKDPFTFELTPPQAAQNTTGTVQGDFGFSIARLSTFVYVNAIDPSGPAWAAGLRRNDILLTVDSIAVTASTSDTDIESALAPSSIALSALRGPATTLNLNLARASYTSTSVEEESLDANTHYVRIGHFVDTSIDPQGPTGELQAILQRNRTKTRWVIDLRWDTGGFLNRAGEIVDLFAPTGRVFTMKDRNGAVFESYDAVPGGPGEGKSLVVLVNGLSASSSEVVTQALRVLLGVKVIGEQTFGKGVSQRVFQYADGGQLLMVSFQLFDANGFSWHKVGIAPDSVVTLDPVLLEEGRDSQLEAALAVLP